MIGIVDPADVSFDGVALVRFVFRVSVFVAPKQIEHCNDFVICVIEKFFLETFDPSEKEEWINKTFGFKIIVNNTIKSCEMPD